MNNHFKHLLYCLTELYKSSYKEIWELLQGFEAIRGLPDFSELYAQANVMALGKGKPKQTRGEMVESVFSNLIVNEKNDSKKMYLPYQLSDLTEVFPEETPKDTAKKAIVDLLSDLKKLDKKLNIEALAKTLFFLQKKYHWGVSAGIEPETVSLFEMNKLRAGLAVCLAKDGIDKNYPFLLACGDVSGIQNFIYNIHSRKAAVALKGRSFYLNLVVEKITEYLLQKTETTLANIVYSSGGKFFLLLPNTEKVRSELKNAESRIITELYDLHSTDLYVCMNHVAFGFDKGEILSNEKTLQGKAIGNMSDLWRTVSQRTAEKKSQKFITLFAGEGYNRFFNDNGIDVEGLNHNNYTPCAVSGVPVPKTQKQLLKGRGEEGSDIYATDIVKKQVELGIALKRADFLTYNFDEESEFLDIGIETDKVTKGHKARIFINDLDFVKENVSVSQGFMFYGGNKQAEKGDKPKEFDELAGDQESRFRRLGILRMDVDGLGQIFISGLQGSQQHFAVYSTLSAQLDLFFSGWLNSLRNSSEKEYKDFVNIIYSGGDDVFAVGRWDLIIDFAYDIRKNFRKFVCEREEISISAGVALTGGKFPISKGAELAGDAEKKAKDFDVKQKNSCDNDKCPEYESDTEDKAKEPHDKQKNAIHFLNETVSWDKEFDFVNSLKETFIQMDKKGMSKNLLLHFEQFKQMKDTGKLNWWWLSAYTLEQAYKAAHNNRTLQIFIEALKKAMLGCFDYENIKHHCDRNRMIDLVALAARYASYKIRQ